MKRVNNLTRDDVHQLATQLFEGNESAAIKWCHEPNRALQWKTPEEIMGNESGNQIVAALITRIEQGVYS
ncbi:TPA: antitoxin Xre/MbcA/ParS toxin-binding domain-containing protein [Citrobacter youngae]